MCVCVVYDVCVCMCGMMCVCVCMCVVYDVCVCVCVCVCVVYDVCVCVCVCVCVVYMVLPVSYYAHLELLLCAGEHKMAQVRRVTLLHKKRVMCVYLGTQVLTSVCRSIRYTGLLTLSRWLF